MLDFIQQVVGGIALGCVYGLIALGFVLIYKATEVVNFAQGDLMMLGGFFGYTFIAQFGFNYWIGFALAVLAMAAFGSLVERAIVRPILGYPQFSIVMVTIGLGFALRAVVGMIWGTDDLRIETPFSSGVVRIGPLVLAYDKLSIIVATVLLCGVLWLYFNRTRMGIAMQATSQNMLGAYWGRRFVGGEGASPRRSHPNNTPHETEAFPSKVSIVTKQRPGAAFCRNPGVGNST